jgi:hypothetical protein
VLDEIQKRVETPARERDRRAVGARQQAARTVQTKSAELVELRCGLVVYHDFSLPGTKKQFVAMPRESRSMRVFLESFASRRRRIPSAPPVNKEQRHV